jgi:CRP-like cAMP-binding protein
VHQLLSQVALFDGIPPDGLARLAELGRVRSYSVGQLLTVQGEVADAMYVILQGRVRLERSHPELTEPVSFGELGPGSVVGHDGLLDAETRSVTVTALVDTEALELSGAVLSVTLLKFPKFAGSLLSSLSRPVGTTDDLTNPILSRRPHGQGLPDQQVGLA